MKLSKWIVPLIAFSLAVAGVGAELFTCQPGDHNDMECLAQCGALDQPDYMEPYCQKSGTCLCCLNHPEHYDSHPNSLCKECLTLNNNFVAAPYKFC